MCEPVDDSEDVQQNVEAPGRVQDNVSRVSREKV